MLPAPTASDHQWTYQDFRIALAFFGEGFENGKEIGRATGQEEPDTDRESPGNK